MRKRLTLTQKSQTLNKKINIKLSCSNPKLSTRSLSSSLSSLTNKPTMRTKWRARIILQGNRSQGSKDRTRPTSMTFQFKGRPRRSSRPKQLTNSNPNSNLSLNMELISLKTRIIMLRGSTITLPKGTKWSENTNKTKLLNKKCSFGPRKKAGSNDNKNAEQSQPALSLNKSESGTKTTLLKRKIQMSSTSKMFLSPKQN